MPRRRKPVSELLNLLAPDGYFVREFDLKAVGSILNATAPCTANIASALTRLAVHLNWYVANVENPILVNKVADQIKLLAAASLKLSEATDALVAMDAQVWDLVGEVFRPLWIQSSIAPEVLGAKIHNRISEAADTASIVALAVPKLRAELAAKPGRPPNLANLWFAEGLASVWLDETANLPPKTMSVHDGSRNGPFADYCRAVIRALPDNIARPNENEFIGIAIEETHTINKSQVKGQL